MKKNRKTKLLVLSGGKSAEHEISLLSAEFLIKSLDKTRFVAVPVLINREGDWLHGGKKVTLEDLDFDLVFPIIHGTYGEDGALQGLLEMANVPYVGPDVLSAAVAMDKDVAKRLVSAAGLQIVPYVWLYLRQWIKNPLQLYDSITKKLQYPLFVKPANTGSSVGISKIKAPEELEVALNRAFSYDQKALVETAINAREIEVAVLGNCNSNHEIIVSIPGEIVPQHEFYSYEAKYQDNKGAELLVPARLANNLTQQVRAQALTVFTTLNCVGMARIDFLLDRETNQLYFNEANTMPGFTEISMYPKLFEASGIPNSELITKLIDLAEEQYQQKLNLKRTIS